MAELRELRSTVQNLVRSLPPIYRSPAILRFSEGLKVNEIAEVLQLNPDAVETRLRRAKAMLREKIEARFPGLAEL